MNILGALKNKFDSVKGEKVEGIGKRRQFNVTIADDLVNEVRYLAAEFAVPRFTIAEHGLAIGCHYLTKAMKDQGKRETLRQHLIDSHLLGSGTDEDEAILTIGEGGRAWQLLALAKRVIRNVEALERAMYIAQRSGDTYRMDKYKRELDKSVLRMADWIRKYGLDEISEPLNNS